MLYTGRRIFINGESFDTGTEDRPVLRLLADQHRLSGEQTGLASADVEEALYTWYTHGWLLMAP